MTEICGIYCIKNKINKKMYIGQSSNIYWRWIHHKSDLNNNRHHNNYLQNAWNKYGKDAFEFLILEECPLTQLNELEKEWIKCLKTNVNENNSSGYNLDFGGLGIRGYKHTEDEINKMRQIQRPKIVLQFDLNLNLIREWIGGVSHINKELHYTRESIILRCEHKILNKMTPYKNSYWIYKDEYYSDNFSWENYFSNVRKEYCKTICQYDTSFNLINKWNSHYKLREAGYEIKPILSICNHTSTQKLYQNCIWAFEDYDFFDGYFGYGEFYQKYKHNTKKVGMKKEKNGNILKTFDSIREACEYLGKSKERSGNLSSSAKKGQRFSGYYWEYL